MTIESQHAGNPPNAPIKVKAVLISGPPNLYQLVRMSDGSTLVASSSRPLQDACAALRAAGESKSAHVDVLIPRHDGVYVPTFSGHISFGYGAITAV